LGSTANDALAATGAKPMTIDNLRELVRLAPFVFRGVVTKLEATTVHLVPVSKRTVLMRVDEVYRGREMLEPLVGKEITVQLVEEGALTERPTIIFATGWLIGEGVALREVNSFEANNQDDLDRRIEEAMGANSEENLRSRLNKAEAIIAGRVTRSSPVAGPASEKDSFHAPEWWQAEIEIDSVLKGSGLNKTISILFPNSNDIAWSGSPKFHPGQEGIWLLGLDRTKQLAAWAHPIEGYTALHPADFQGMSQMGRIERLLR